MHFHFNSKMHTAEKGLRLDYKEYKTVQHPLIPAKNEITKLKVLL